MDQIEEKKTADKGTEFGIQLTESEVAWVVSLLADYYLIPDVREVIRFLSSKVHTN